MYIYILINLNNLAIGCETPKEEYGTGQLMTYTNND